MALQVVDRAIQSFGAEGISQDTPLAQMWAGLRTLRFADVSTRRFDNATFAHQTFPFDFRAQMRYTCSK